MKITVLAIGKTKGDEAPWCDEYLKRLGPSVTVRAMAASSSLPPAELQKAEAELLLKAIPQKAVVVVCDERGKDLKSREFAGILKAWEERAVPDLVFIIGGADGVTDKVRARADFMLGFGVATWPHKLVRVMLLEQIYRARQINAGHPYHRD